MFIFIDTEFYNTNERYVSPVCLVARDECGNEQRFWFPDDKTRCVDFIEENIKKGAYFVSYFFEAEARFLLSIGIDIFKIKPICLYILYRQLLNSVDEFCLGEHYDGEKVYTVVKNKKSKYVDSEYYLRAEEDDEDDEDFTVRKPAYSLIAAIFKMLGVKLDQKHKDEMRDRILKGAPFTQEEKEKILEYCADDVKYLPDLLFTMSAHYMRIFNEDSIANIATLSKYTLHSALMVSKGYPVLVPALKYLISIVPQEINRIAEETDKNLREKFNFNFFTRLKNGTLKENQKELRDYIAKNFDHYEVSEKTQQPKLSEDALKALASIDYFNNPQSIIDYICRYKKLIKSLKSFRFAKGRKNILDYLGSDGRIRPNMGIFTAQTSRSQPSSTSFIHLKAAVFRFLVHPRHGRCIFSIDYKSQEFLIAAANSEDENMLEAYYSGDPYMYLAINIGLCPPNATKHTHPNERKLAKTLELALTYGMGTQSVARRLGVDSSEAKRLIKMRERLYARYTRFKRNVQNSYKSLISLKIFDGWYLGSDNENMLSVLNFPGQGTGAAIMRRAVMLCHEANLDVIFTLHDALYFECDAARLEESIIKAADCMRQACRDVIGHDIYLDIYAWGVEDVEGRPVERRAGEYKYSCSNYLYEDKVDPAVQEEWHRRILGFLL